MLDLSVRQARAEQMLRVREVRRLASSDMELREDASGTVTFRGLASRTATPYDMGWYDEQIARGAFKRTLERTPDVQLLINHDGLPLARTTIPHGQYGHLSLREGDTSTCRSCESMGDNDGLRFYAETDASDPDVQRLSGKVRSGLMDQCSFAFRVIQQKWTWTEDETDGTERDQREIKEVSLDRGDVSVCNYGANPATPVTARGLISNLADLSDEDLDELREDPTVLEVVRRLGFVQPTPVDVPVVTEPTPGLSADLARARAWALINKRTA